MDGEIRPRVTGRTDGTARFRRDEGRVEARLPRLAHRRGRTAAPARQRVRLDRGRLDSHADRRPGAGLRGAVPRQPRHGRLRTRLRPQPQTIDAMAADLVALLDACGIDRLPAAGRSMGGSVAQALACRAPERVSALVRPGTDPGGAAAVLADAGVWAPPTSRAGTPREQASRLISVLFPPGPAAEIDAAFGDVVAAARAEVSTAALDAQEAAMRAWHAREPASSCSPAAGARSWPRSPRGSPPSSRSSSVD